MLAKMKRALGILGLMSLLFQATTFADEIIAVGDKAPAFVLENTEGEELSLEKQLEEGPVVLVFFRSGDW